MGFGWFVMTAWGLAHQSKLIECAQLQYWRERQKEYPAMPFDLAQEQWDERFRSYFIRDIEYGKIPDIISGFFDYVPKVYQTDFRAAALQHDIDYWKGGCEQARRNADDRLYWAIKNSGKTRLARLFFAPLAWIAVRLCGWRQKHFCYDRRAS